MTVLAVPSLEEEAWPTLGPQVCAHIETNLTFGPGDLLGVRAKLDDEKRALVYRAYEVFPQGAKDGNGKPIAGRRRFRRCAISLREGKREDRARRVDRRGGVHHLGPVRCDGFDANGRPVGRPVSSPYIPMVAYTEEQAEDLAYGVLKAILERSPISNDFDIGLERISRARGDGKLLALAGAPDSRDGALTTFAHKDETHRWTSSRLKRAHRTMLANLTKRLIAEPWELETTTAYSPGEGSVAEETAGYAAAVAEGRIKDSKLFFFHRQASDGYDWTDPVQRREALTEAAGPTAGWKDIDGISEQWQDPHADLAYLERVFGNRPIATASQAFNALAWADEMRPETVIAPREAITLGFDGSKSDDATALIATHIESGFQWPVGIWETRGAEIPREEINAVLDEAFHTYQVHLMYADKSWWDEPFARWEARYGDKRVVSWGTSALRKMAVALRAYANAINAGEVTNNGDPVFARHIGNAQKHVQNFRDDDDSPLWLIRKDRPGSPNKIDAAMAGCLSWSARLQAVAAGVKATTAVSAEYSGVEDGDRIAPEFSGVTDRRF